MGGEKSMNKYYVVRRRDDESKLAVIRQNFAPKDHYGHPPFDELTGEPEDAAWLQIESVQQQDGSFKDVATVNQIAKDQVLQQREADAEAKEDDRKEDAKRRNKIKKSLRSFKDSDLSDSVKIKQALRNIIAFIKENNDLTDEVEE